MGFGTLGLKVFLGELLGTFVHVYLWDASIAQVIIGLHDFVPQGEAIKVGTWTPELINFGNFPTICFGFGASYVLGNMLASRSISGGHLNPAVTLAMAICGRIPAVLTVAYWSAQFVGAILGSLLAFAFYSGRLEEVSSNLSNVPFSSIQTFSFTSIEILWWDSIWSSAIFCVAFLATTDPENSLMAKQKDLRPLLIGLTLTCLSLTVGSVQWTCLNPARELIPQILSYAQDKGTSGGQFPIVPFCGPFIGSALGSLIYNGCIAWFWPPKEEIPNTDEEEKVLDIQDIVDSLEALVFPPIDREAEYALPMYIPPKVPRGPTLYAPSAMIDEESNYEDTE